jgi:hypothetical protein
MRPLAAACALALFACAAFARDGPACQRLFGLRRSVNRNEVVYEACFRGGAPDRERPIRAHWLMHATDGHREELTALEERLAYGVLVSRDEAGGVSFALRAAPGRRFSLRGEGEEARAIAELEGEESALIDVYVELSGGLLPSVRFVDLAGVSLRTGATVVERLKP